MDVVEAVKELQVGAYPVQRVCPVVEVIEEVEGPTNFFFVPGNGDCALYSILATAMPIMRPPPLNPHALQAVPAWSCRRILANPLLQNMDGIGHLHLAWLLPPTVVQLASVLGIY